jgi:hypothetical protein
MNKNILIAQTLILSKLVDQVAELTAALETSNKLNQKKMHSDPITHRPVERLQYRSAALR